MDFENTMAEIRRNNRILIDRQGSLTEKNISELFDELVTAIWDDEDGAVINPNAKDGFMYELFSNYDITPKVDNETGDAA